MSRTNELNPQHSEFFGAMLGMPKTFHENIIDTSKFQVGDAVEVIFPKMHTGALGHVNYVAPTIGAVEVLLNDGTTTIWRHEGSLKNLTREAAEKEKARQEWDFYSYDPGEQFEQEQPEHLSDVDELLEKMAAAFGPIPQAPQEVYH